MKWRDKRDKLIHACGAPGGAPWGIKIGRLGGSLLSLDDIEHGYLR